MWRYFVLALIFICAARADEPDTSRIEVHARIADSIVTIDSSLYIDASPSEVWAVVTDYDHAAAFISNLEYSRVESREGNTLLVHQKGGAKHWPFTFSFEALRKVRLTPYERLESHLVQGTLKKLGGLTLLKPEANGTRLIDRRDTIPDFWLPPILGHLFVEHQTRGYFAELRAEIMRRKQAASSGS